jgi:sodium transport system ATP-binding protein
MRPGEVVSVTGRNGAGKTTLLRILGGLVAPDRGDVVLDGIQLGTRRRAYQRQIGLLTPGDRGLYARVTVARHLDLWARLALLERDARAAAISDCYARFDLAELADLRVDVLSMGQRQRVRLALAFLHSPGLVLLDEPANSLDLEALAIVRGAVDDVARRGDLCLVVAPEGASTGIDVERALVLREGRLEPA